MEERHDGAGSEARAEAEADVDQDQERGDAEGVERGAAQIAAHPRAHELDALDLERADGVGQGELEPPHLGVRPVVRPLRRQSIRRQLLLVRVGERDSGRAAGVCSRDGAGAEADQVVRDPDLAEADHAGVGHAAVRDHPPERALVDRRALGEAHLHLGAAGEIDPELDPAHGDRNHTRKDQQQRHDRAQIALADEVDVGVRPGSARSACGPSAQIESVSTCRSPG